MKTHHIQPVNPRFKIPFHQGDNRTILLPVYNIPYIKADNQVSLILLDDGENLKKIYTTVALKLLTESLKKYHFIRTHRSYLVNLSYIKEINCARRKIILVCGHELPVPPPRIKEIKIQLRKYSSKLFGYND